MKIYVDVDLRQVVASPTQRSPIGTIEVKNQDTLNFDVFFCSGGNILDYGSSAALKFGLVAQGATTLLVLTTAFVYKHDNSGNAFYSGQPVFNTTNMQTALGSNKTLACAGEIRFEQPNGEIVHCLSIPFQVDLTLVPETGATPPTLSGTYPDASTLVLLTQADTPGGWLQLDSGGLIVDARIPATVERLTNKNQPGGYVGLTAGKIAGSVVPVDGSTIGLNGSGQLSFIGTILASLSDFETSTGVSLIHSTAGVLNRLVAGTGISFDTSVPGEILLNVAVSSGGITALSDAESSTGLTLVSNVNGILKRLAAGTNITLDATSVPGSIIINAAGGGGSGISALSDAETSTGISLIENSSGILKRLVADDSTIVLTDHGTSLGIKAAGGGSGTALTDAETTVGKTLLGTTAGTLKRIVAGTNITLDDTTTPGALTLAAAGGGGGGGVTPIHCEVTKSANWTWADTTPIPWDSAVNDTTGMWNSGAPTKLTVTTAGLYLVSCSLVLNWGSSAAAHMIMVAVNGLTRIAAADVPVVSQQMPFSMTGTLKLIAGDYVELMGEALVSFAPSLLMKVTGSAFSLPNSPRFSLDLIG